MKLISYKIDDLELDLRPASSDRQWMDESRDQFAKRCLPLVTANAHGWHIHSVDGCSMRWNGGIYPDDLKIKTDSGNNHNIVSEFGHGILTFRVNCLFRTEPGLNLFVTGPVNTFKDGVQPLSGLVETDWMPYTFTMNWKITRPRKWFRFDKGEPIAQIFPVPRGIVDETEPEIVALENNDELQKSFNDWRTSRNQFIKDLARHDPEAVKTAWQKFYFRGLMPDGTRGSSEHQTKIRPKPFRNA